MNDLLAALPPHLRERAAFVGERRPTKPRFVVYWMRVAMRGHDNPALDAACALARALSLPVAVYQGLSERYPYASDRHHTFILEGAADVARELGARGITYLFHLERGARRPALRSLAKAAGLVVADAMPTPPLRRMTAALAAKVATIEVDASCVVPMSLSKEAPSRAFVFAERTARERHARLAALAEAGWPSAGWPSAGEDGSEDGARFVPAVDFEPVDVASLDDAARAALVAACDVDHGVGPVRETRGGGEAGYARWRRFVEDGGLAGYAAWRDDPLADGVSRMSAYLHYGMVSPFRLAAEAARARDAGAAGAEKFLDELLTWRELAWHAAAHLEDLESLGALPKWARDTLREHEGDPREPRSWETLARARTGDALWDAAQRSLLRSGELHNNVRMTWGKAVLGWTRTPKEALGVLVDLNHRYALDGRDPASYGGLLWCLGLFDRPFEPPTPVLGKVRARPTEAHAARLDVERYAARTSRPSRAAPPSVAIVGAGIAGLSCARTLNDHGWPVQVFDKGRRAPGGRCSSRWDGESEYARWVVDHGASLLVPDGPRFRRHLRSWAQDGLVAPWEGRFVRFEDGRARPEQGHERWVATPTMSTLAAHLADDADVTLDVRVDRVARDGERWRLSGVRGSGPPGSGRAGEPIDLGAFDVVVIATPAPQAAPLLAAAPSLALRAEHVAMDPCLVAMVAFERSVEPGWDAAFDSTGELQWMSRESSKPERPTRADDPDALDAWVLQAGPKLSEALLELPADAFADELLARFEARVGPLPRATWRQGHRWRYAQVSDPVGEPCLFDVGARLGACGDWCLGPRLEDAFESGVAMAGRVLAL